LGAAVTAAARCKAEKEDAMRVEILPGTGMKGVAEYGYLIVGGPANGFQFVSLLDLFEYARERGLDLQVARLPADAVGSAGPFDEL
jgi:hypothetical protein